MVTYNERMQQFRNYNNAAPRLFVRSRVDDYSQSNPRLAALIARREAAEDYRRRFGRLPR